MRTYESVVVIDSLLKSEEIDGIIEKIVRIISNNGGKIQSTDRWGKRRLTYEIKKRQYGFYVNFMFEAPYNLITILEREYSLEENILRYLTVYLNSRALQQIEQQKSAKKENGKKVGNDSPNAVDNEKLTQEAIVDLKASGEVETEIQDAISEKPIDMPGDIQ